MKPVLLLLAAPLLALAQPTNIQFDPAATRVEWTLGTLLHTVHGTFKLKHGEMWFDPATGKAGGAIVVDATSGESGSGSRDSRMHKSILESPKFTEITFVPDHVEGAVNRSGDSDVQIHGAFTLHGSAHELVVKAHSHIERQSLTATLAFPVPYIKWGLKNPSTLFLKVDDSVAVNIQAIGHLQ